MTDRPQTYLEKVKIDPANYCLLRGEYPHPACQVELLRGLRWDREHLRRVPCAPDVLAPPDRRQSLRRLAEALRAKALHLHRLTETGGEIGVSGEKSQSEQGTGETGAPTADLSTRSPSSARRRRRSNSRVNSPKTWFRPRWASRSAASSSLRRGSGRGDGDPATWRTSAPRTVTARSG